MNSYENRIYNEALNLAFPPVLASFIAAQGAHETGNFTSAIFTDCNNAFGYKAVRSSCSNHSQYQNYDSIEASTDEICQWILRRVDEGNFPALSQINDPGQYAQLLKDNGYYEDSVTNYTNGLLTYLENFSAIGGAGLLIIFAIGIFLLLRKGKS